MPIEPIDVSRVEAQAENIYEAIVVMSKRARQINEDIKIQLNQRLETLSLKPRRMRKSRTILIR